MRHKKQCAVGTPENKNPEELRVQARVNAKNCGGSRVTCRTVAAKTVAAKVNR